MQLPCLYSPVRWYRHARLALCFVVAINALPANAANTPGIAHMLRELAQLPAECIGRADTSHALFHGCIDWHSAVHAHWALLRAGRALSEAQLISAATRSLARQPGIKAEHSFLAANPKFEMPYGRAWFLLLAQEYRAATGSRALQATGDLVAASLREYLLAQQPGCASAEPRYQNASWAYTRLLAYERFRGRSVDTLVKAAAACAAGVPGFVYDTTSAAFFSPQANLLELQAQRLDPADFAAWWRTHGDRSPLTTIPVRATLTAHHLAINYSRASGLRVLARHAPAQNMRTLARKAYAAHLQAAYALHDEYASNYGAYGHWVAQFGIYAMTDDNAVIQR